MIVHSIFIDGETIPYVQEGKGIPVLFIHGFGVTPHSYQETILELSKQFQVIAPFYRGGTVEEIAKRIEKLRAFLGIEKIIVMGHSSGGMVGISYVASYPSHAIALVLVDGIGVFFTRSALDWFLAWISHVFSFFVGKSRHTYKFIWRLSGDFFSQILLHPIALFEELQFILKKDLSTTYTALELPIFLVWGEDDLLVPQKVADLMHGGNKNAKLLTVSGNHNWIKINAPLLRQGLIAFLNESQIVSLDQFKK